MKLLVFPQYTLKGASSRYRIYQYLPFFNKYDIKTYPFFDDKYIPGQNLKTLKCMFYICKMYIIRLYNMFAIIKGDVIFLQYEFTKFLPFNMLFFRAFKIKYIVDYDDAIFHDYDQHSNKIVRFFFKYKIANVIKHAEGVITGSPYLTTYALKYNKNVIEIPTSINIDKYFVNGAYSNKNRLIIGWIGSSTTSLHLRIVIHALNILKKENIDFELKLIGYDTRENIDFNDLPVNFVKWEELTEIQELSNIDVGIMPLIDFPFARGKCAFKLIQYMALGKPTISSSFEANLKVDINKENLFADTTEEWVDSFKTIINNREYYKNVGLRNRKVIEENYTIQANYLKYLNFFKSIKNER